MLNEKARGMIKKTLIWKHRSKDDAAISIPYSGTDPAILKIRLLGNTELSESGELLSVGDYDSASGKYVIPLHVHGRNYIDGTHFLDAVLAVMPGKTVGTPVKYRLDSSEECSETPVYTESYLKFKPNTVYTVIARGYVSGGYPRFIDVNLGFRYEDGSIEKIRINNPDRTNRFHGCSASTAGQNIKHIETYHQSTTQVYYYPDEFGIFEGKYTDAAASYEAYDGERISIKLDEPLRGIGVFSDEIDFLEKSITRRICLLTLIGTEEFETDEDGYCYLPLGEPARTDYEIVSLDTELIDEERFMAGEDGIFLCGDGTRLYIRAGGTTDSEAICTYLSENPIRIMYTKLTPTKESLDFDIPYRTGYTGIEVYTETAPRRFYAEYY